MRAGEWGEETGGEGREDAGRRGRMLSQLKENDGGCSCGWIVSLNRYTNGEISPQLSSAENMLYPNIYAELLQRAARRRWRPLIEQEGKDCCHQTFHLSAFIERVQLRHSRSCRAFQTGASRCWHWHCWGDLMQYYASSLRTCAPSTTCCCCWALRGCGHQNHKSRRGYSSDVKSSRFILH